MPKCFLVTGGAGFIGSNFIEHILTTQPDARVITVDGLTYAGSLANLEFAKGDSRHRFVQTDIRDEGAMLAVMREEKPDCVMHFAAESHVDRSIESAAIFESVNVGGTLSLLETIRKYLDEREEHREGFRFIHISTDEVYGDLPIEDTQTRFKEDAPLRPSSPYAASKAASDMFVLSYIRTYGLPAVIVRMCNNYGPRQHSEKFIPCMIQCALAGEALPLYGAGENVREWLHVEDACRAIAAIAERGRAGEVYNVSSNDARSNMEVAQAIVRAMRPYMVSRNMPQPRIEYVADRLGHDRRYALDATKCVSELGWTPTIEFERGIGDLVEGAFMR